MSAEWQLLVSLNEQLRPLKDAARVKEIAVRRLGEHLQANRVQYAKIDGDEYVILHAHGTGAPTSNTGSLRAIPPRLVEAFHRGETIVIDDVAASTLIGEDERRLLLAAGIRAGISTPLIKGGRWVASLGVHSDTPRAWTPDQVALVEITAQRLWGVHERAVVEEALDRSGGRHRFLQRLNDVIRPLADPTRILEHTCRLLATHLRVESVTYVEVVGDDCVVIAEHLNGLPPLPRRFSWSLLVGSRKADIALGGSLISNDTSRPPHTPEEIAAFQRAGVGAYNSPLLVKDGEFIGAFGIHSRSPRTWTPEEVALASEVADRVWATLEHRRAEAELRANEERLAFLLRLNDALRGLSDPALVQTTASRLLSEHLGCTRAGYAETDGDEYVIRHEHTRGVAPLAGSPPGISVGSFIRESMARGETVVVHDIDADSRLGEAERASMRSREIAAFVGVALFRHERMVAVFGANHHQPRTWTNAEAELVRNVAERTWDAVERTRAEAAVREQKQRLQLALEASGGGSWTWSAETGKVDWDPRFRELYGFAPDEPATNDKWAPRVHEEDRARLLADLGDLMTSSTRDSWQNTFRVVRADGTMRWVQSRGHAERDSAGRIVRLSGLDLDFTQHRRAEEAVQALRDHAHHQALQARTDELEYRTTQLSQMASDLTLAEQRAREQIAKTLHDGLQQLLVVVAVNLEIQRKRDAERGVGPSEQLLDAQRHLDEAITAARSLNLELFPPVLARSGLPAAFTWLAGWATDKYKLEVVTRIDPRADSSRKDVRTLLFESVRELLLNTVKHAKATRVMLELFLDADDHLRITVADEGVGFDQVSWLDRTKSPQAGWGLFSIRERLTSLGGQVSIESSPGRGTRVTLRAPRGGSPAVEPPAPAATPVDGFGSSTQHEGAHTEALRILIVDDHPAMRNAIRDMLREKRELVVVGEAANGVEGIAQAHTLRPDVILMDVAMPHMDGIEATRRIHAELPRITIVGLSTHARSESAEAMELAGAADFFVKGVDTGRLMDYLVTAARRRSPAIRG